MVPENVQPRLPVRRDSREQPHTQRSPKNIMERLEDAIARGNHKEAARLAKEVSKLHITAKLTNQEEQSCQQQKKKSQSPLETKLW